MPLHSCTTLCAVGWQSFRGTDCLSAPEGKLKELSRHTAVRHRAVLSRAAAALLAAVLTGALLHAGPSRASVTG